MTASLTQPEFPQSLSVSTFECPTSIKNSLFLLSVITRTSPKTYASLLCSFSASWLFEELLKSLWMKTRFQRASNRLMCDIGLTNELYCANSASVNIDILLLILRNLAISHEIATTVPRFPLCCGFDRWYLWANFLVCSSQPPLCTDLSRSSPSIAAEHPEQHVNHCRLNLDSLQCDITGLERPLIFFWIHSQRSSRLQTDAMSWVALWCSV